MGAGLGGQLMGAGLMGWGKDESEGGVRWGEVRVMRVQ